MSVEIQATWMGSLDEYVPGVQGCIVGMVSEGSLFCEAMAPEIAQLSVDCGTR